jgi:hypothetical protein
MFEDKDDSPPGILIRIIITLASIIIATATSIFEYILKGALDLIFEKDLIV